MARDLQIERLVWFGDSLTDESNIHDVTERTTIVALPVQSAGYSTAFTNGEVHASFTSDLLAVGHDNYAVGYGHALGSLTVEEYGEDRFGGQIDGLDIFRPDASQEDLDYDLYLGGQVERFLEDTAVEGPVENSAAAFLIGLNDYSEFRPSNQITASVEAAALVAGVVGATVQAASTVAETGVETILFYTMPSFRFFPLSSQQSEDILKLGDQLINAHNTGLEQGAALLERTTDAEVEFIDFNRLADELMDDPETFGLRSDLFDQPALLGTGGNPMLVERQDGTYDATFPANPAVDGVDLDQLAFFDFIHPTAAVHETLGAFTALSLTSKTIFKDGGDDAINGTKRSDLVLSGSGSDRVETGAGNDAILAGLGADTLFAGGGHDIVSGGSGNDFLRGGGGHDVIADGTGDDKSRGGRGNDLLIDGNGFDTLDGGRGEDAFLFVDATLRVGDTEDAGGVMKGGRGFDTAYFLVEDATREIMEGQIVEGETCQSFASLGLTTKEIESYVFLDPAEDLGVLSAGTRQVEAELWGLA